MLTRMQLALLSEFPVCHVALSVTWMDGWVDDGLNWIEKVFNL